MRWEEDHRWAITKIDCIFRPIGNVSDEEFVWRWMVTSVKNFVKALVHSADFIVWTDYQKNEFACFKTLTHLNFVWTFGIVNWDAVEFHISLFDFLAWSHCLFSDNHLVLNITFVNQIILYPPDWSLWAYHLVMVTSGEQLHSVYYFGLITSCLSHLFYHFIFITSFFSFQIYHRWPMLKGYFCLENSALEFFFVLETCSWFDS